MNMTDPIADMLTRIRNGYQSKLVTVDVVPFSKVKLEIAKILKSEGYIAKFLVEGEGIEKKLIITLKYTPEGEKVMQGIKRISKPGLRVYAKSDKIPRVLNGLGVAIISTSQGMMTDREARKKHIGGEVIAYVW